MNTSLGSEPTTIMYGHLERFNLVHAGLVAPIFIISVVIAIFGNLYTNRFLVSA